MKKYHVVIESKSPYLQHRMDDIKLAEWEKTHSLVVTHEGIAKEDAIRAEYHCHRNKDGKCFIPSDHIKGALMAAGKLIKSKVGSSTKSMTSLVAAFFTIESDQIIIPNWDSIDKRSAVNRNIHGRVIVVRPQWTYLKVNFECYVDNDTIPIEMIQQLFDFAGNNIGIGSFRPTNSGKFGRFSAEITAIK